MCDVTSLTWPEEIMFTTTCKIVKSKNSYAEMFVTLNNLCCLFFFLVGWLTLGFHCNITM